MTVTDAQAEQAMRTLASGEAGDVPVLSGESGAAGLAALQVLAAGPAGRDTSGLGPDARVLLISTEGATAPGVYRALTGRSGEEVVAAQRQWLAREGMVEQAAT
jgi:threonine dehydratase